MSENNTILNHAVSISPIVAGATIASVLQAREPSTKTWQIRTLDFIVDSVIGTSTAYFLAGWATEYFHQTTPNAVMAIGFLFGAIGVQLIRWTIKEGFPWLAKRLGV
jgi:hypothetical protein